MNRPGPLLRTGKIRTFKSLGVLGRPLFNNAQQIRATVSRQLGEEAGAILAVPQINEAGDEIDWYAPFGGATVVPWSAATEEERSGATAILQRWRQAFVDHGQRELAQGISGDRELFARMLEHAHKIPESDFIHLVDGKPVLTFWGFERQDAPAGYDVVRDLHLRPPAPPPSAPIPVEQPVTAEPPRGRPWWLWLLGLLLLLGLLFFLLRSCGVPLPIPGLEAPSVSVPAPGAGLQVPLPNVTPGVPAIGAGDGSGNGGAVGGVGPRPGAGGEAAAPAADRTTPSSDQARPETADKAPPPPSLADPGKDGANDRNQDEAPPSVSDPAGKQAPPTPPSLTLPKEAMAQGSVGFLDGRWRSRTGLFESETGRPVDVIYDFKDGKGTATIERADGSKCVAPAEARVAGGALVIDQTAGPKCADGTSFQRSRVECRPGSDQRADCKGSNAGGSAFQVQIVK